MALAAGLMCLALTIAPALGADYDTTEKSPLYELKAWTKIYTQRSGQSPGQDTDRAGNGIAADPEKLKPYALTYAKGQTAGQTAANGILLLYGAGQIWPHVLGDFRLAVPAAVFTKYLTPQWKGVFNAG
ncbi:hypothetical protein UP10_20740 [Bradyrhizobium sp. LTSPM299]|nr:hypothetical protein UP10_20740 [Bradyrhizobium sp. LTSPM299]